MRLLEDLRGRGQVYQKDGSGVIEVRYSVAVFQELLDTGPGRPPVEGLKQIVASVSFEGDLFEWVGKDVTLRLENGLCLDGFISDNAGTFAPKSGLYVCP